MVLEACKAREQRIKSRSFARGWKLGVLPVAGYNCRDEGLFLKEELQWLRRRVEAECPIWDQRLLVQILKLTTESRSMLTPNEKGGSRMASRQVSLSVNDVPIELDYFVQGFIDHVMGGMIAALKDTGEIRSLDVSILGDTVTINLNNATVATNPFVNRVTRNTIVGMVSSLKGVSNIDRVDLSIRR